MEDKTKAEIALLRESGLGYKAIAKRMLMSVNTVKTFRKRAEERRCRCDECGKPLPRLYQKHQTRPHNEYALDTII